MIETLLPGSTRTVESFGDRLDATLFAEEEAVVARAGDKRRREFATVRACARDALAALGVAPAAIVPGASRAPTWPPGVVGSMTHCTEYRGAAVARAADLASIGIDVEPNAPLPEGVLSLVARNEDLPLPDSVRRTGVAVDRLLFSAKESVYKAWFPLAQRWLGFEDATVRLRADGTFTTRILVDARTDRGHTLSHLEGRWTTDRGLIGTAVVVT